MNCIEKFEILEPITEEQLREIILDIEKGNAEARRLWKRTHKTLNRRVMKYSVGLIEFIKIMGQNAEYLSKVNTIMNVSRNETCIEIEIDGTFIELLNTGSSLGLNHISRSIHWISEKTGQNWNMPPEMYSREGFREYLKKALKDNNVKLKEEVLV